MSRPKSEIYLKDSWSCCGLPGRDGERVEGFSTVGYSDIVVLAWGWGGDFRLIRGTDLRSDEVRQPPIAPCMMFQLCEIRVVKQKHMQSMEREMERELKVGLDGNGIPVMWKYNDHNQVGIEINETGDL
jgi:hypothetical protein